MHSLIRIAFLGGIFIISSFLPMYDEPYEVVRESFARFAEAHYPKDKMIVVLALEERAGDAAREMGERSGQNSRTCSFNFWSRRIRRVCRTRSPAKVRTNHGPARGRKKRSSIRRGIPYDHILVSVFDIDTQVFPEYFSRLRTCFLRRKIRFARSISRCRSLRTMSTSPAHSRASFRFRARSGR